MYLNILCLLSNLKWRWLWRWLRWRWYCNLLYWILLKVGYFFFIFLLWLIFINFFLYFFQLFFIFLPLICIQSTLIIQFFRFYNHILHSIIHFIDYFFLILYIYTQIISPRCWEYVIRKELWKQRKWKSWKPEMHYMHEMREKIWRMRIGR